MKAWEIIGYSYEADLHCPPCTLARFNGIPKSSTEDSEGNTVHPVFASDELEDGDSCGDCHEPLL